MSVKGFKLNDGTVVRYDYSALDDIVIDDTLAVTGAAADAKATGDAIDNMESKIGDLSDLTTTDKTSAVDAINELKTDIDDLTSNYTRLDTNSISVSSGTIANGSSVEIYRNSKGQFSISYYIRMTNPNGRVTVTISNFPSDLGDIYAIGNPTHVRIGSNQLISDNSVFSHSAGESTASINMLNFIGEVCSGSGWMVYSGSVVVL